ncbi:MAG: glutamate racemase [Firmicutes bacterium]|jgi:glutamate racemase|nr:glutamate racemase [Bacillota bacterium]
MDNRAIGIFDSGVGGLSCVKPLLERMPGEHVIYFGDTARTPYGSKSDETVREFSLQIADFLCRQGVKMLVSACNTISATALDVLREAHPGIPVIGTIEPAAAKIAKECGAGSSIGIMATRLTVKTGSYEKAIHRLAPELNIHSVACPALVPLIEEGFADEDVMDPVLHHYLDDFIGLHRIDTLVLGCTHYPFIEKHIASIYRGVKIINPAYTLTDEVQRVLSENGLLADGPKQEDRYYASDLSEPFMKMIRAISAENEFRPASAQRKEI